MSAATGAGKPSNIIVRSDRFAPVAVALGREHTVFVNPYTGAVLGEGATRLRGFFEANRSLHRWLLLKGDARDRGKAITGAANLIFLFIVLSGLILWIPRRLTRTAFRNVLWFRGLRGRARDLNWHHVLGIWAFLPLVAIVFSGVVISYPWASRLVYSPPKQQQNTNERGKTDLALLDRLSTAARAESSRVAPRWQSLSIRLPLSSKGPVTFALDEGNGARPDKRSQLLLDPKTARVVEHKTYAATGSRPKGARVASLDSHRRGGRHRRAVRGDARLRRGGGARLHRHRPRPPPILPIPARRPRAVATTRRRGKQRMSGRRSKQLRKMTVGAMMACTAFSTRAAIAQTPAGTTGSETRATAQLPLRKFEIAAGSLSDALRAFEAATGVTLRVQLDRTILDALHSPGATGLMPDSEALAQLLSESGIQHRFTGRRTAVLTMPSIAEAIEVSAPAPEIASPKFTQPLLETPRTVAVIPDEVFLAQGATTLRDVLRNTPGITFQAGEGGGGVPGDSFSMRGFSAGNDILLDGVRESGAYTRDAFNLEQVEVIKGPSGAIAGRGGTGGAINLITKTPKPEAFTRATVGTGNAGYVRTTVDTNTPLESNAAVRTALMYTSSDVPGRDVVHNSSWGIAPSLSLGIGKPSRFTLAYQHQSQDNVPDYGLPWAAFESKPRVDQTNFYGLEGYDYEKVRNDVATATFERDLREGWTLRTISRWADNHRDSAITSPRPPNRQLQQRLMDQSQLTNQTSVTGHFGTHALVAGVEVGRETTFIQRQSQTTNQPQTTLTNPNPHEHPIGPMPANTGNPEDTQLSLAAIYALDTFQLGSRWEVMAGLRWDSVDVDYELTNLATAARTRLGRDDRMLSWNSGIVFKPRPNATLYTSFATSFNPTVEAATAGAGLSDTATAANNVNLAPEKEPQSRSRREVGIGRRPRDRHRGAVPDGEDERAHARFDDRAVRARRRAARRRRRAQSHRQPHRALVRPHVLRASRKRVRGLGESARAGRGAGVRPRELVQRLERSTRDARVHRRRRHAVHGLHFPQRHQHRRSAELLAGQRHGRVRRLPLAHAAPECQQLDERTVRRPRRRRPLHSGSRPLDLHQRGARVLMLLQIPNVLTKEQVRDARARLDAAEWVDGRVTAGHQSARSKDNEQIPEHHPVAREVGESIVTALARNPLFRSAALPLHVFPPLFNRYSGGQSFGSHVDNAVRPVTGTAHQLRTDLSATLFLSDPDEYDGGDLVIEDTFGVQSVKLAAGNMILYPASSLHHVRPVTRGARVSSFFWIQSMVRDDGERTLLFDLDLSIQRLGADHPDHASVLQLTGVYHNLLRRWADL